MSESDFELKLRTETLEEPKLPLIKKSFKIIKSENENLGYLCIHS